MRRLAWTFFLIAAAAFGQLDRGSITGVVTDPTGALVPSARIIIQNTATGAKYETVSNAAGQYTMPNLPAGTYQLTFEAPGFKKLVRAGVELGITSVLRVDAALSLGEVSESVEVTAEITRLQTETPETGTSLSNKQLIDLPLSFGGGDGRQAENFAYKITPGVAGGMWKGYINGSTGFSKETLLEGATVTMNIAGNFVFSSPSVEALQEFKVQTSGISAEFGRTQAGVFNYVMKSGANQAHGSGYGSLHNEAFNANTFANKFRGDRRGRDRQQNFAGSFGGPVYLPRVYDGRNRTFFYVAYERYRNRATGFGAPSRTVPLPEFYDGNFSQLLGPNTGFTDALGRQVARGAIYDPATFRQLENGRWVGDPFVGNIIPVSRFSQISQRLNAIAKQHYLPTVRDASGQIPLVRNSVFPSASIPELDQHQFSTKADQILSSSHKISASYVYVLRPRLLLDQGGMWDPLEYDGGPLSKARRQIQKSQLARASHDWTMSPRILNHFTLFYNRLAEQGRSLHAGIDGAKQLGIRNLSTYGYPTMNWGGGPVVTLENPGDPSLSNSARGSWGFLNTVSFSQGRHFMKAGFDFRRNTSNIRYSQGGSLNFAARGTAIPTEAFSGNQTGYAFATYLLGIVDSAGLSEPVGAGGRHHYYALFLQDDFKISRRLTLNLGMRWEYQPPGFEAADRMSSWNPDKIDPASGLRGAYDFAGTCDGCTGKRYFGARSLRDWGPRIGFAFRPVERWVLRGSYGIFYTADVFNGYQPTPLFKPTNVQLGGTYELSADPVQPWAGLFKWDDGFPIHRYVPPSRDVSWGNRNRPGMMDPNYGRNPYIQQWNFNIQRELIKKLVLDVGYVGNKSTGLYAGELSVVNQLPPSVLAKYGAGLNNAVRNAAEAAANGIPYPFPGFRGTVAGALRPFPQVNGNNTVQVYGSPLGFSTYHALQITVNRQFTRGLTVYANYVWSKTMQNIESSLVGDNTGRPLDTYNVKLEKSISEHDIPHMVKVYLDYELPVGRGRAVWSGAGRAANAVFGGWSVSAILNYYSGVPLGFGGSSPLVGGWNGVVNRANIATGEMKVAGFSKSNFELSSASSPKNTFLNTSLFSDPPPLTLGAAAVRYAQVRGFGAINEDFGLQKNQKIGERYRFQLRAEFLNAFNRHSLGGIITGVRNPLFGQVTSVFGNRVVQLGARFDF